MRRSRRSARVPPRVARDGARPRLCRGNRDPRSWLLAIDPCAIPADLAMDGASVFGALLAGLAPWPPSDWPTPWPRAAWAES
eukprot:5395451-Pyramimonas_sp.AAC.2